MPTDLDPGQEISVVLVVQGQPFDKWTDHPEVGTMTSGGEGEREHATDAKGSNNQLNLTYSIMWQKSRKF